MPIYDYVCGSCGHRFEVFRGINEAGPPQCPECGGPVARAIVPPTIHFKGSGWAKTDRRATSARARRADTPAPVSESAGSSAAEGSGTRAESPGTSAGADATPSSGAVKPTASNQAETDR